MFIGTFTVRDSRTVTGPKGNHEPFDWYITVRQLFALHTVIVEFGIQRETLSPS